MEPENRKLREKLEKLEKDYRDLSRAYLELNTRQGQNIISGNDVAKLRDSRDGSSFSDFDSDLKLQTQLKKDRLESSAVCAEETPTPDAKKLQARRVFDSSFELTAHHGAVYCIRYNKSGNLIASGGFDKQVRVWSVDALIGDKSAPSSDVCSEHTMHISDLNWTVEGHLLSTSYDKTLKVFDVASQRPLCSFDLESFGLSTIALPWDPDLVFAGTSQGMLLGMDFRASRPAIRLNNGPMVNALEVCTASRHVLMGDADGYLKAWDMRRVDTCVWSLANSQLPSASPRAVSHLHLATFGDEGSNGSGCGLLAASSHDGNVRVYAYGGPRGAESEGVAPLRLVQVVGTRSRLLPIRASLHLGDCGCRGDGAEDWPGGSANNSASSAFAVSSWARRLEADRGGLLVTGSGENVALVYALDPRACLAAATAATPAAAQLAAAAAAAAAAASGGEGGAERQRVQELEGHRDRVYAAQLHPTRLELATCAADGAVRIWTPAQQPPVA